MQSTRPDKVLVLGDDTRSFLSIVRSLGRKGVEAHAAPLNFRAPALLSRYVKAVHRLPYYIGDGDRWTGEVVDLIERENFSLVIPCDDRALLPFHWRREQFEKITKIAVPNDEAVEALFDKVNTRVLAERCGVPVSEGLALTGAESAEALLDEYGSPLALKPRRSFTPEHLYVRTNVIIAQSPKELARDLGHIDADKYFVEKYFDGDGIGVSVLASEGHILQGFEHHRVHEPPQGGGSSYRKSAQLDPELFSACDRIMSALNYTGLAMFEFKKSFETDAWILLEVNARPWGSLPLPLSCGVDFPFRLYDLLVNGRTQPHHDYVAGRYCRNILQDYHCLIHWAGAMRARPLDLTAFTAKSIAEFGRVLTGREKSDTFAPDDLKPAFAEVGQFFGEKAAKAVNRLTGSPPPEMRGANDVFNILSSTNTPKNILFVCLGNICRSPYAERYMRQLLQKYDSRHCILSAGTLPMPGRRSPDKAIAAAARSGIELGDHRSFLFDDLADSADAIIVFDEKTYHSVMARDALGARPIVKLGAYGQRKAGAANIEDPFGQDDAAFDETYRRIREDIDSLVDNLSAIFTAEAHRSVL